MAREFAKKFYNSSRWKECRKAYINKMPLHKRGLCERCYDSGKHTIGEELHHIIHLTPDNIDKPEITLNHKNLIYLCRDCHMKEHGFKKESRYTFDEKGNIIMVS